MRILYTALLIQLLVKNSNQVYSSTSVDALPNKQALFVSGNPNDGTEWAFVLNTPLDSIDQNNYGFYAFWLRIVGSELRDGQSLFQFINFEDFTKNAEDPKKLLLVRQTDQTYICMTEFSNNTIRSQVLIKDGWNHVMYGFNKNSVTWQFWVNMQMTTFDMQSTMSHPDKVYFFRSLYFKESISTIKLGEIQFFNIPKTQMPNINDIMERYIGLTWRYVQIFQQYLPTVLKTYLITLGQSSQNAVSKSGLGLGIGNNQPVKTETTWPDQVAMNRLESIVTERVWWDEAESALNLCNATQRYNSVTNLCIDCVYPCKECSYFSESKCFSCVEGYTLVGNQCTSSDCPRGTYYDSVNYNCVTCTEPCSSCTDATTCLFCTSGYLYIDDGSNNCIKDTLSCPKGTYLDTTGLPICKKCSIGCKVCDSTAKCTECQSQYLLYKDQCILDQCPSGSKYENQEIICKDCDDPNCKSCNGTECFQCGGATFLSQKKCVDKCPDGTYADLKSKTCMKCQVDCLKCSGNNYTCSACTGSTYLLGSSCVKQCPKFSYYQDDTTKECKSCNPKCQSCTLNKDDCSRCAPGNYLQKRQCDSSCPTFFFKQDSTRMCQPCHASCKDCYGSLSSQCTSCSAGNFLKDTTCMGTCPKPYFPNGALQTCVFCQYFCDYCTSNSNCLICLPGYQPIPNNCSGEYYLRTQNKKYLSLPINTQQLSLNEDPRQMTVEVWFKSDNINSINLEVILSLGAYKLRKRQNQASIHLYYQGQLVYCDTAISLKVLQSNVWYHFAWSLDESNQILKCYLDGESISVGTNSAAIIAQKVQRPSEIILGGASTFRSTEVSFNGQFKELRIWKIVRSPFQINYLRNVDVSTKDTLLYAYWKFDEKNDGTYTYFKDSSFKGVQNFNPKTVDSTFTVQNLVVMREINLKICKEGFYLKYQKDGAYYTCLKCNSACKNCKGPTINDCVECIDPYQLVIKEFTCKIIESCPEGQFIDSLTGLCNACDPGCKTCAETNNFCQQCKANYFREYQGTGCVDTCPFGMYGDFQKQNCYFNPLISSISPPNGTVYSYGTFIDLESQYSILNNEENGTYSLGWLVIDLRRNIDVSGDIVKPYYQNDLSKVHLDKNVIEANRDYKITFYVKGNENFYKGMYTSSSTQIYIGSPPRNGKCIVSPLIGIATLTEFTIQQENWSDEEVIVRYDFSYSIDGGDIYIPMSDQMLSSPNLTFTFDSTYNLYTQVKIKCKATNARGFSSQVLSMINLEKSSSANATKDLEKIDTSALELEIDILQKLQQINLIAQNLGKLQVLDSQQFDPRVEVSQCTANTCSNRGNCTYLYYTKKYHCSCKLPFGGQNCTFDNANQIQEIKQKVSEIASIYNGMQEKQFELEFLKLSTSSKEVLSDSTFEVVLSIMAFKIQYWKNQPQSYDELNSYMKIVSNILEFLEEKLIENQVSKLWEYDSIQAHEIQEYISITLDMFDKIRDNSLKQISIVTTSVQFTTRMITYRQILLSQGSLTTLSASNFTKKNMRTFIKLSPNNFLDASFNLEQQFVIEAIEFAINPYQLENKQSISNNVFSVKIYNSSTFDEVKIKNMKNGFEIYFPVVDNQNLTNFAKDYNSLSPYRAAQNYKRIKMMESSTLDCNYWDGIQWTNTGCIFNGVDKSHIKCICNHLTAFGPQFITPPGDLIFTNDDIVTNKYLSSDNIEQGTITKQDLLVPLNKYFDNLQELLQHKTPKPIDMIFKPGTYVVFIFWFMYISSLFYYSGRDRIRRGKMTKKQIRDDLAEIKDTNIQQLHEVMQDLLIQDALKHKQK
eukprot:403355229